MDMAAVINIRILHMNSIGHVVSEVNKFEYIDDNPIKVTLTQGQNSTLIFFTYVKSLSYLVERT